MKSRVVTSWIVIVILALGSVQCFAQNPYLDVVDALVGDDSIFNGPDRAGGEDTLHGEVDAHWWEDAGIWGDYSAIDIYADPDNTWADVDVPTWEVNSVKVPLPTENPSLPNWMTTLEYTGEEDIQVVTGKFLTGAVLWPHEEYVEQFAEGVLEELDEDHMVPVYWLCKYVLFIPDEYAGTQPNDTAGKALIVYGKGRPGDSPALPTWMSTQLTNSTNPEDEDSWLYNAGVMSCRRLRVPVLVITVMPDRRNTWLTSDESNPQGGILGYDSEGRVTFPTAWAARQDPEPDLIVMHTQYMYAASYVRAVTFLDGFFNPTTAMGTDVWSQWDEITGDDTARYTPIDDVIIEGGSKRGYATWIAAVADSRIKAIVANGIANLHIEQQNRLAIDEKWETAKQKVPGGREYQGYFPFGPDDNQIIPTSRMQSRARFFGQLYRGEIDKFRHYSIFDIFKNRDVMKDSEHPENPQPEIRVYNLQGAQDPFWGRNAWVNWFEDEVFHGEHQYLELNPFAVHPPYYEEFTRSMQSFCESVWFGRPMPNVAIKDVEYEMPYIDDSSPPNPDLIVRARFQIDDIGTWALKDYGGGLDPDDPQNFRMRLCVGIRPVSTTFSRGMWSDYKSVVNADRSTPWWEIAPTSVTPVSMGGDTVAYDAVFKFVSSEYPAQALPPGFGGLQDLIIDGVPAGFHIAFYVRAAVEHEDSQHDGEAYPVRVSSVIEYLPPWGVGPGPQVFPEVD